MTIAEYEKYERKQRVKERVRHLRATARGFQRNPTEAETALLARFCDKDRDIGAYFIPQVPLCGFIVDFYCKRYRIAIEVDGAGHDSRLARLRDSARDSVLNGVDIKVLRFSNEHVLGNVEDVIAKIKAEYGWLARRKAARAFSALPGGEDIL